jgi:hypothetical protein
MPKKTAEIHAVVRIRSVTPLFHRGGVCHTDEWKTYPANFFSVEAWQAIIDERKLQVMLEKKAKDLPPDAPVFVGYDEPILTARESA